MSKAKPWPTVANRHRVDAIMKAGELRTSLTNILDLLSQLREAVTECNLPLALAIVSAIEGYAKFEQEAGNTIINLLESAPSDD